MEPSSCWKFSINATNGTLTPIPGSPFAANCESRSGTVDFTGNFLVIAVTDCNEVQVYRIDQNSGALTSLGTSPTNDRPFHVAEAAAGGNFYMVVNNLDDSNLIAFQFNDSTGALTSVGTPFSPANSNWPHFMAVDTSGKFGYVVDYGTPCCNNAFITGVTVGSNGSLAAITGSPFTTGGMRFPTQIVLGH